MKLVMAKDGYRKVGDKYLLAKKCTKCGKWLVASTANFYKQAKGEKGLHSQCKKCKKKYHKQYCKANKEKVAEAKKQYYEANKDKILEQTKQRYEANKDKILEYQKQYCQDNKEKITERKKQYYEDNKEKIAEWGKQYREANKERIAERKKQYYEANKDKIAEYKKQWRLDNKDKVSEYSKRYRQSPKGQAMRFNASNKRRHKKANQGTGVTPDQWLEMMQYFDWRCAYTGEKLTDKTRSGDHVVPIDAGGDDMVWNMVPMLRNLNSSKQDKDMLEWYREQSFYDPKRLEKIYDWQEYAYNKYGKDSEYFNTNDIQIKLI